YRAGEPNDDLFALIRRNVRFSEKMIGDVRAQIAAGWIGARGLEALAREFKLTTLRSVADDILRRTEAGMRARIRRPPGGPHPQALGGENAGRRGGPTRAVTATVPGAGT